MIRLRETFARLLLLKYDLDENLATCQMGDVVWAPAQLLLNMEALMESINVDRLVRPGSRLPSQEEDDDLQILDPAKHAELVRYRVLSGETLLRTLMFSYRAKPLSI